MDCLHFGTPTQSGSIDFHLGFSVRDVSTHPAPQGARGSSRVDKRGVKTAVGSAASPCLGRSALRPQEVSLAEALPAKANVRESVELLATPSRAGVGWTSN